MIGCLLAGKWPIGDIEARHRDPELVVRSWLD